MFLVMAETCAPISRVYSSEAPVGAWMATMRYPWSSVGTKPLRHVAEDEVSEAEAGGEENEGDDFKAQKRAKSAHVAVGYRAEHTIDLLGRTSSFLRAGGPAAALREQASG